MIDIDKMTRDEAIAFAKQQHERALQAGDEIVAASAVETVRMLEQSPDTSGPVIPNGVNARLGVQKHDGYDGDFTRAQSPIAKYKNGSRVRKIKTPLDADRIGATGTVLGSIGRFETVGYFVEWDDRPRTAVFIPEHKLEGRDLQ